jgi:hypothetical protein
MLKLCFLIIKIACQKATIFKKSGLPSPDIKPVFLIRTNLQLSNGKFYILSCNRSIYYGVKFRTFFLLRVVGEGQQIVIAKLFHDGKKYTKLKLITSASFTVSGTLRTRHYALASQIHDLCMLAGRLQETAYCCITDTIFTVVQLRILENNVNLFYIESRLT